MQFVIVKEILFLSKIKRNLMIHTRIVVSNSRALSKQCKRRHRSAHGSHKSQLFFHSGTQGLSYLLLSKKGSTFLHQQGDFKSRPSFSLWGQFNGYLPSPQSTFDLLLPRLDDCQLLLVTRSRRWRLRPIIGLCNWSSSSRGKVVTCT